jgi:hypothetical protein
MLKRMTEICHHGKIVLVNLVQGHSEHSLRGDDVEGFKLEGSPPFLSRVILVDTARIERQ